MKRYFLITCNVHNSIPTFFHLIFVTEGNFPSRTEIGDKLEGEYFVSGITFTQQLGLWAVMNIHEFTYSDYMSFLGAIE